MADLDDIEFKIARLELGPDDILVVRAKEHLPDTVVARMTEILRKGLGARKCLVLDSGMDLAVLTMTELQDLQDRAV